MRFERVVDTSARVAATASRNAKTTLVAQALVEAGPEGARLVAAYLAGTLPQRRTGVGWRSLSDLPAPAEHASLEVGDVDAAMTTLARTTGSGSAARRRAALHGLFAAATASEQAFLRGLLTGELRQGASDGVLLAAIAEAAGVPAAAVRRAVMLAGWPAEVAPVALAQGEAGLALIALEVGRPLRPMLAGSAPDVAAAFDQVGGASTATDPASVRDALSDAVSDAVSDTVSDPDGPAPDADAPRNRTDPTPDVSARSEVALERKLDGIRLQIHKAGDDVRLFTRSLEEITDRLPEVVALVRALPADALVLDAEALALREDGRPHPFQVTGARTASRTDPAVLAETTPVTTYVFDLLHVDGEDLLDVPAADRAARLARIVPAEAIVDRLVTADPGAAADFFADQVAAGHEGVVVKALSAPYAAGRRGAGWVKVKPRHTLDLVVLAVEWGSGRRRGLLSNIHLGARDDASPTGFVMLGKTFKGMTDETLAWQTARFLDLETHRDAHVVHVRPEQVVEIAFDGLQRSTRYPGGLALRFARVLRYRDDKSADEADSLTAVRALATS
ncbi:ATP-dependent DNA ligase [Agilicoccus flavus]|uniref:ATP-dependent DNA ligase n=1 Tax=Agilicoccus flavus TaxID=2775968 RepID=UPI001CF6B25F|nr:ATP-dependent DNA ligase [Agilicoccus flavus]